MSSVWTEFLSRTEDKIERLSSFQKIVQIGPRPKFRIRTKSPFSALSLLVGQQEWQPRPVQILGVGLLVVMI